jgi:pimeloyl-ACP methyl ester carboxylesterase
MTAWPADRWADVGGRRIRYWVEGEGAPPVVVLGGLGTTVADWVALLPQLAADGQVLVHDRAGLGASDDDPQPRTAGRMVDDLRAVLEAAGLEPPYVLLGHSWGGLVARVFAHRHPEQVAGLVLVDATHEDMITRLATVMNRATYRVMQGLARTGLLQRGLRRSSTMQGYAPAELDYVLDLARPTARTARREALAIPAGIAELANARVVAPDLAVPVVALSAGGLRPRRGPAAKVYGRAHALHEKLATPAGYHQVVPGSGHYVHLDQPAAVLDAVRHVRSAARSNRYM